MVRRVKSTGKSPAAKCSPTRKAGRPSPRGKRNSRAFAPELCGIMTGPADLSLREGFGRHG